MFRPFSVLVPLLLVAFFHGVFYVMMIPPWDLYDEGTHLAYALVLRDERRIPHLEEITRNDVVASEIETDRWGSFRIGKPDLSSIEAMGLGGRLYQGYQPPLYYVTVIPASFLGRDVLEAMYTVRMMGPFLLAALVAITWALARLWSPCSHSMVPAVAALSIAVTPAAGGAAGRVNNDLMAATLIAAGFLASTLLLRRPSVQRAAVLGVITAAAILTKSHGIILLPIVVLGLFFLWRRNQLTAALSAAALLPGLLAFIAWSAWIYERYGTLTGTGAFLSFAQPFEPLSSWDFVRAVVLHSWSSYWATYDGGMFEVLAGIGLLAIIAIGLISVLRRGSIAIEELALSGAAGILMLAILWYGNTSGLVYPQGRIVLPLMPVIVALVSTGWDLLPGRGTVWIVAAYAVSMSIGFILFWFIPFFSSSGFAPLLIR
jgi:hypothetical protein